MAVSNKTDQELNIVNIVHEGPESYENMWQKVRAMWSYVYDHYYEKYDWFYIGTTLHFQNSVYKLDGDDLHIVLI